VFETAAACGVREVKLGYVNYKGFGTLEAQVAQVQKDLDGITSLAHSTGVRANIHTHSGPVHLHAPATCAQLIKDRDPASIGAYVDAGHMTVEGSRDGWRQGLDLLGSASTSSRSKTSRGTRWTTEAAQEALATRIVPVNRGAVAWPEVFDCLKQLGFNGWVSVHSEYQGGHTLKDMTVPELIEQTREDLAYLREAVPDANVPRLRPRDRLSIPRRLRDSPLRDEARLKLRRDRRRRGVQLFDQARVLVLHRRAPPASRTRDLWPNVAHFAQADGDVRRSGLVDGVRRSDLARRTGSSSFSQLLDPIQRCGIGSTLPRFRGDL
jgi:sugar phosphate isomerase/epimerase